MIKGKNIIFGHGSVSVITPKGYDSLMLAEITPPQEIGSLMLLKDYRENGVTFTNKGVVFQFNTMNEVYKLMDELDKMNRLTMEQIQDDEFEKSFEYHGYKFDFNLYNWKSIKSVRIKMCQILDTFCRRRDGLKELEGYSNDEYDDIAEAIKHCEIIDIKEA